MSQDSILDTNVIIRFLVDDDKALTEKARQIFGRATTNSLVISDVVFTEIIYVLLSIYELDKADIIDNMRAILHFEKFKLNKKLLSKSLDFFENENISYVDAYILSQQSVENAKLSKSNKNKTVKVVSFDRKLEKISTQSASA